MKLTDKIKEQIDSMSYESMLRKWRFSKIGDEMFQGEIGEYFKERMKALRESDPQEAVRASKSIGWG